MQKTNKHTVSSEQTREKLIQTGIRLFALYGMNGVRTRQLAEEAGVNQSAIPYHLDGKQGVYAAVIRKITDDLAEMTNAAQADAALQQLALEPEPDKESLRRVLVSLMKGLGQALLSPDHALYAQLILREQLEQTEHYDVIYHTFILPVHERLTSLIRLVEPETDMQTAIIAAHALIGQVLGFVVAKKAYLRRSGLEMISDNELPLILHQITGLSCRALGL
ncbi:CerR family C-terminal domain-containing protein [Morganella psychrotolerans]|uniref:DUF1956 domain-containing protein n=1 Tax=Morganella psychrotolerans TaxID=368603 RepID=A0A5M9R843_9GAMM|nr:CerR family C-terminal domain-containing protein [Morganella psychrotolerans]KAA8716751.1 DUF1956 domain-containing protein [Morganella psychrotolerans]OBU08889.1 TetR family transcriptional regulator [Morganella psychrotolerans]